MEEYADIALRLTRDANELLLSLELSVEREEHVTAMLGNLAQLIKMAEKYGGQWVEKTGLIKRENTKVSHTFRFPNITAMEQFINELPK